MDDEIEDEGELEIDEDGEEDIEDEIELDGEDDIEDDGDEDIDEEGEVRISFVIVKVGEATICAAPVSTAAGTVTVIVSLAEIR